MEEYTMKNVTVGLIVAVVAVAAGIGIYVYTQPPPYEGEFFTVRVVDEVFVLCLKDPQAIEDAIAQFEGENSKFPIGPILRGDGGFNEPWSWHLDPENTTMTDFAVEVCDGRPSFVEENVDYFVDTVGSYCPWGAEIIKVGR
jgi:hypothetical protein